MHKLESIDWRTALSSHSAVEWFLTLTVHQDEGVDHAKRALKAFRKRLFRAMPGTLAAWKLEPQKRGAPHYHIVLVVDLNEVSSLVGGARPRAIEECDACPLDLVRGRFQQVALEWWREVTHQSTIDRVWVEEPRSSGGLRRYMSKYMAKSHPVPEHWQGHRYWGFWGQWPRTTIVCDLPGNGRWQFRRMIRAWNRSRRRAARLREGLPGAGRDAWTDAYGGMRVCVPAEVLYRLLEFLPADYLGSRDGPPVCLSGG